MWQLVPNLLLLDYHNKTKINHFACVKKALCTQKTYWTHQLHLHIIRGKWIFSKKKNFEAAARNLCMCTWRQLLLSLQWHRKFIVEVYFITKYCNVCVISSENHTDVIFFLRLFDCICKCAYWECNVTMVRCSITRGNINWLLSLNYVDMWKKINFMAFYYYDHNNFKYFSAINTFTTVKYNLQQHNFMIKIVLMTHILIYN